MSDDGEIKLTWKRTKLSDAATAAGWLEGIAPIGGGGNYKISGKGSEYWIGYHRPKDRRSNYVKIGTAPNIPDAMRLAEADYAARCEKTRQWLLAEQQDEDID